MVCALALRVAYCRLVDSNSTQTLLSTSERYEVMYPEIPIEVGHGLLYISISN